MATDREPLSADEDVERRRSRAEAIRAARASDAANEASRAALFAGALAPCGAGAGLAILLWLLGYISGGARSLGDLGGILFVTILVATPVVLAAQILGYAVGRLLARFQLADSRARLVAQGALIGGAMASLAGLLLLEGADPLLGGARVTPAGQPFHAGVSPGAIAAVCGPLGVWGAICGGAAGLGVFRIGRRSARAADPGIR